MLRMTIRTHRVRTSIVISNMVPCNNESPGGVKINQVWSGKAVNHFNQVRVIASGNILVVDPSTSDASGVNIVPIGGYNCTPIYTRQDCAGGVQWKVTWWIWGWQWQTVTEDTAVDIEE